MKTKFKVVQQTPLIKTNGCTTDIMKTKVVQQTSLKQKVVQQTSCIRNLGCIAHTMKTKGCTIHSHLQQMQ